MRKLKLSANPLHLSVGHETMYIGVKDAAQYGTLQQDAGMIDKTKPAKLESEIGLSCPLRKKKGGIF